MQRGKNAIFSNTKFIHLRLFSQHNVTSGPVTAVSNAAFYHGYLMTNNAAVKQYF